MNTLSWLCVVTACLFSLVRVSEGQFSLEVMLHTYANTDRRDSDGQRCPSQPSCRNRFTVATDLTTDEFSFDMNSGNSRVTFASTIDGNMNPLPISSPSSPWPGSFQLSITVENIDNLNGPLIEEFIIPVSLSPSDQFTVPATYQGEFNNADIELSFRVMCLADYYGSDCSVLCMPTETSTCNPQTGAMECLEGFTDPNTLCTTPVTTMRTPTVPTTSPTSTTTMSDSTTGVTTMRVPTVPTNSPTSGTIIPDSTSQSVLPDNTAVDQTASDSFTMTTTADPGDAVASSGLGAGQVAGLIIGLLIAMVIVAVIVAVVIWRCSRPSQSYKLERPVAQQSLDNPNYEVVALETRSPSSPGLTQSYQNVEFGRSIDRGDPLYSSTEGGVYEVPLATAEAYEVPVNATGEQVPVPAIVNDPDYCFPSDVAEKSDYCLPPDADYHGSQLSVVSQDTFDNPEYAEINISQSS